MIGLPLIVFGESKQKDPVVLPRHDADDGGADLPKPTTAGRHFDTVQYFNRI